MTTTELAGRYWLNNKELAAHLGISVMQLWRWQHDPALRFPQPATVGNLKRTDARVADEWMATRSSR